MSEQKPSHEVKGIVHRGLRQDCVEAQIWWGEKKMQLGEKGLGQEGDQEPYGHSERAPVSLWRWENLPEGQPSLQHSTNQALMVEWPDGSHSSVECT